MPALHHHQRQQAVAPVVGRGTIASRYLEAIACANVQDVSELSANISTPPRSPKWSTSNYAANMACGASAVTATTVGVDQSGSASSWTTHETKSQKSRSGDNRSRQSGNSSFASRGNNNNSFTRGRLGAPNQHAQRQEQEQQPPTLGMEDDCSSIESSSSHRRRPAHVSLEEAETSSWRTINAQSLCSTTPPKQQQSARATTPSSHYSHSVFPKTSPHRNNNNVRQRSHNTAVSSVADRLAQRPGTPLSKQQSRGTPSEVSENAPTEVMMNLSSNRHQYSQRQQQHWQPQQADASSEAGAPTEVMTNRTQDVILRYEDPPQQQQQQQQQQQSPAPPPPVGRVWQQPPQDQKAAPSGSRSPYRTTIHNHNNIGTIFKKPKPQVAVLHSLIDDISNTSSAARMLSMDETIPGPSLLDGSTFSTEASSLDSKLANHVRHNNPAVQTIQHHAHVPAIMQPSASDDISSLHDYSVGVSSVGVETGGKRIEKSTPALKSVFGGRQIGAIRGMQHYPTQESPLVLQQQQMQQYQAPPPPPPQRSNNSNGQGERVLMVPDFHEKEERASNASNPFIVDSGRRQSGMDDVFQKRSLSETSSGWTPMSLSEKDRNSDFAQRNNGKSPIQPLFSMDKLDTYVASSSPMRKAKQRSHSSSRSEQNIHRNSSPSAPPPTRSKSLNAAAKKSSHPLEVSLPSEPDPIFCPHSMSINSTRDEVSHMSESREERHLQMDTENGVEVQRRVVKTWPAPYDDGDSIVEEELVEIMEKSNERAATRSGHSKKPQGSLSKSPHQKLVEIVANSNERKTGAYNRSTYAESPHQRPNQSADKNNAYSYSHNTKSNSVPVSHNRPQNEPMRADNSPYVVSRETSDNNPRRSIKDKIRAFNLRAPAHQSPMPNSSNQSWKLANLTSQQMLIMGSHLAAKTGDSNEEKKIDDASVDVKRIRYAYERDDDDDTASVKSLCERFEGGSREELEDDDDDDDTASVKSLRERFEPTHRGEPQDDDDDTGSIKSLRERFEPPKRRGNVPDNEVSKMRARFEASQAAKRSETDRAARVFKRSTGGVMNARSKFEYPSPHLPTNIVMKAKASGGASRVLAAARVPTFKHGNSKTEQKQKYYVGESFSTLGGQATDATESNDRRVDSLNRQDSDQAMLAGITPSLDSGKYDEVQVKANAGNEEGSRHNGAEDRIVQGTGGLVTNTDVKDFDKGVREREPTKWEPAPSDELDVAKLQVKNQLEHNPTARNASGVSSFQSIRDRARDRLHSVARARNGGPLSLHQKRMLVKHVPDRLSKWGNRQAEKRNPLAAHEDAELIINMDNSQTEIPRTHSYDLSFVADMNPDDNKVNDHDRQMPEMIEKTERGSFDEFFKRTNKAVRAKQAQREASSMPTAKRSNRGRHSIGSAKQPEQSKAGSTKDIFRKEGQLDHLKPGGNRDDRPPGSHWTEASNAKLPQKNDVRGRSTDTDNSDGVTLDVSIADVSNITDPTAIRSKGSEGQHSSTVSSDEEADLLEAEAKKSEASSSQLSEAAAPLIAGDMRMLPLSDELSRKSGKMSDIQSFVANRKTGEVGWDDVRSSFPVQAPSPIDPGAEPFPLSEWHAFDASDNAWSQTNGGSGDFKGETSIASPETRSSHASRPLTSDPETPTRPPRSRPTTPSGQLIAPSIPTSLLSTTPSRPKNTNQSSSRPTTPTRTTSNRQPTAFEMMKRSTKPSLVSTLPPGRSILYPKTTPTSRQESQRPVTPTRTYENDRQMTPTRKYENQQPVTPTSNHENQRPVTPTQCPTMPTSRMLLQNYRATTPTGQNSRPTTPTRQITESDHYSRSSITSPHRMHMQPPTTPERSMLNTSNDSSLNTSYHSTMETRSQILISRQLEFQERRASPLNIPEPQMQVMPPTISPHRMHTKPEIYLHIHQSTASPRLSSPHQVNAQRTITPERQYEARYKNATLNTSNDTTLNTSTEYSLNTSRDSSMNTHPSTMETPLNTSTDSSLNTSRDSSLNTDSSTMETRSRMLIIRQRALQERRSERASRSPVEPPGTKITVSTFSAAGGFFGRTHPERHEPASTKNHGVLPVPSSRPTPPEPLFYGSSSGQPASTVKRMSTTQNSKPEQQQKAHYAHSQPVPHTPRRQVPSNTPRLSLLNKVTSRLGFGTNTAEPKNSALMARLKAVKEARLRRAASRSSPTVVVVPMTDQHQEYRQSAQNPRYQNNAGLPPHPYKASPEPKQTAGLQPSYDMHRVNAMNQQRAVPQCYEDDYSASTRSSLRYFDSMLEVE
jgi:hypothetical protein